MSLHRTVFTFLVTAVVVGQSSSFTPDYAKAKMAAQKVFKLINSVPSIDSQSEAGTKPVSLTYTCGEPGQGEVMRLVGWNSCVDISILCYS